MTIRSLRGSALWLLAFPLLGTAQIPQALDPYPTSDFNIEKSNNTQSLAQKSSTPIIWSEDFANGIPTGWVNSGTSNGQSSTAVVWEYRGPNTTPDNTNGSRGAYSGVAATPPTNSPLNSTSTSNGFIIFDSDYLDNNGSATNQGGGPGPAPHVGTLTTTAINLSQDSLVILEIQSYARVFFANFQIALSADNGATWTDTILVHSDATLGVNGGSINGEVRQFNVSNAIGGATNAKLRFIFDGTPGNANGNGYYHWMLDDIALVGIPDHNLRFTGGSGPSNSPHYIEYDGDDLEGRYGHVPFNQLATVAFGSEIENFGSQQQTNVRLQIDIETMNGVNVQTLSTSPTLTLNPGQIANVSQLFTGFWSPNTIGQYNVIYSAVSDSVSFSNPNNLPESDTFQIWVTDTTSSLDFGSFDNRFGTENIGDDNSAVASRFDLNTDRYATSVDLYLSATTVPGGVIEVTVQDTVGFSFTTGFQNTAIFYAQHSITAAEVAAGKIQISLRDQNGLPLHLDRSVSEAYFVVVTMFSNAGANPIALRNDQTFEQSATTTLMYYTLASPRWYTGFNNSLSLNAPHIRLNSTTTCGVLSNLGSINTACSSFTGPSGRVFTQSGTNLYDTVSSGGVNSCDTLYVFDLNLNAIDTISATVCAANPFTFFDGTQTTIAGTYSDLIPNGAAAGCDSTYYVTLTSPNLALPITRTGNVLSTTHDPTITTFQWYECTQFGVAAISGETSNSYTVTQNGDYTVVVEQMGCSDTLSCFSVNDIGIEELESSLEIFPNPADNHISIRASSLESVQHVELIDVFGRVVMQAQPTSNEIELHIPHLTKGLYLLRITMNDGSTTVDKITVSH